MSDPYERAKGGRLTYKGGAVASRSKTIDKKKKKKPKLKSVIDSVEGLHEEYTGDGEEGSDAVAGGGDGASGGGDIYTIDAAKKMKYDELFPVEAKKFGYDPKEKTKSVEEALDDRVKKKADRYCK